jgi:hypothetical protein
MAMKLIASGVIGFGGHGEIAFVFAILIVGHHQHAACAEIFEGFRNGRERHSWAESSG